jgi:hypothetical protein
VHAKALRQRQDSDLSLHNLPLHLAYDIFTLGEGQPDVLTGDSVSATIKSCDFFNGESFTGKASFNPDDEFHGVLSVGIPTVIIPLRLLHCGRVTPRFDTVPLLQS